MRWRIFVVSALTLWALYAVSPSIIYFSLPKEKRNSEEELKAAIPKGLPEKHVKLGLDLQGGVQLVLGVSTDTAVDAKLARIGTEVQRWADDQDAINLTKAYSLEGKQTLRIELAEGQDMGAFKQAFKTEYPGLIEVDRDGDRTIDLGYDEEQIKSIRDGSIVQAERVIRNRVDKWGVANPIINRRRADNSILVQLPGFRDPEKARSLLGRTAQLRFSLVDEEFKGFADMAEKLPEGVTLGQNDRQPALVSENRELLLQTAKPFIPEDKSLAIQKEALAAGNKYRYTTFVVAAATEITGEDVIDAFLTYDAEGLDRRPQVSLRFTGPGGKRFADVTGENVNKALAIIVDDEMISAPNIQQKISGGNAVITMGSGGNYQAIEEEAKELALTLKSGSLPATIEVKEERQVGASLGPELADQGVKGTLLGLALVFVFMLVYYRRPGIIACVALFLNGVFLLALMGAFGFALTLPGIAGFILTLGMAVDANVLINERIRQELRDGKNAKKAVENGFKKVFWTIIDANVTTLIAALVLLETNSSGPIKGFATTLMIGLLVSMFTSLYCSRLFFDVVMSRISSDQQVRSWLGGKRAVETKEWKVNFLHFGKIAAAVGIVAALVTIGTGAARGLNWGVDFQGGTEMMLGFTEDTTPGEIQGVAKGVGINNLTLQALEGGAKQYLLRFGGQTKERDASQESIQVQEFKQAIMTKLSANGPDILQTSFVGPQIGRELRTQGVVSVFYAIVGVLLYIGLRFDMRFAPGAVVKMMLDVVIMFSFYIFFWRSFDLTSVAAFLTVVGYSVNDTIVIYDRIRENLSLHVKRSLFDNINRSLNECLTRTINTSITTVVALIGILVFGTGQIWNFAMAMAVGVIAATLSSQFLASSFVLWLEGWKKGRARAKASGGGRPAPARS